MYFNCRIHPGVSCDNVEDEFVENEYEEIDSVSYHSVNWRNYSFEPSNDLITPNTESEGISNDRHISSSSGSNITLLHFYDNTYIDNSNDQLNMSSTNENSLKNQPELETCSFETNSSISKDSSATEQLKVQQYVNITHPNVINVYEELKNKTADIHKYGSLQQPD